MSSFFIVSRHCNKTYYSLPDKSVAFSRPVFGIDLRISTEPTLRSICKTSISCKNEAPIHFAETSMCLEGTADYRQSPLMVYLSDIYFKSVSSIISGFVLCRQLIKTT